MLDRASQLAAYFCLGTIVVLSGFVWCPCDHANASDAPGPIGQESAHACCQSQQSQDQSSADPGKPDEPESPADECPHCDRLAWAAECSTPADPVWLIPSVPGEDLTPSTISSVTAGEDDWPAEHFRPLPPGAGIVLCEPLSLRAVNVLLTV